MTLESQNAIKAGLDASLGLQHNTRDLKPPETDDKASVDRIRDGFRARAEAEAAFIKPQNGSVASDQDMLTKLDAMIRDPFTPREKLDGLLAHAKQLRATHGVN